LSAGRGPVGRVGPDVHVAEAAGTTDSPDVPPVGRERAAGIVSRREIRESDRRVGGPLPVHQTDHAGHGGAGGGCEGGTTASRGPVPSKCQGLSAVAQSEHPLRGGHPTGDERLVVTAGAVSSTVSTGFLSPSRFRTTPPGRSPRCAEVGHGTTFPGPA